MNQLVASMRAAVSGDVGAVAYLANVLHDKLVEAGSHAGRLTVTPEAVLRALESYRRREVSASDINRWAWFVMRGYIPGNRDGPLWPVAIDYKEDVEDEIAAVLSRLTELGDEIDGTLEPGELDELVRRLAAG